MATQVTLTKTVTPMNGGVNIVNGVGQQYQVTVSGTWTNGDTQSLTLTDSQTGIQTLIGAGTVSGITPTFGFTFNNKQYFLAGQAMYFSELDTPNVFDDINTAGNGFIALSNYFSTNEDAISAAPYQGNLLIAFRRMVQIWVTDPDPDNYQLKQNLQNIGTFAPLSVQAVGDMDVYMLYDSGVRSVRVRDSSNNAIVSDVGTPIDKTLQPLLASLNATQKAAACGIVDPTANRYWIYIPKSDGTAGRIYVFSYFPSSEIAAWSAYIPSYNNSGSQTTFIPQKFFVYQGQVWASTSEGFYQYGGTDNVTYDNCGVTVLTPYIDSESPATMKSFNSVDAAFQGTWTISASADYQTQSFKNVYANTVSSWQLKRMGYTARGTHYAIKMVESGSVYALFSSAAMHVDSKNEK